MDDLIQRARNGDSEAFVALFEENKQSLWRAAMAVLGNVDDAADALQDTMVKAWKAMPRFGGRCTPGTWFMRILLNTSYDLGRKRQREMPCAFGFDEVEPKQGCVSWESAKVAARLVERESDSDMALDVRNVVASLSADDRLVLVLFYVDEYPVRQIASIMNLSEGAVRTRLSRARDRFKVAYGENAREEAEVVR